MLDVAVASSYPGHRLVQSIPGTSGAEEAPSLLLSDGKGGSSPAAFTPLKAGGIGGDGSLE